MDCGILERRAHDFGRVDHAMDDQILIDDPSRR